MTIHVEDLTLGIHQKLAVVALDLNSTHYHVVLHVDADLLVSLRGALDAFLLGLLVSVGVLRQVVLTLAGLFVVNIHVVVCELRHLVTVDWHSIVSSRRCGVASLLGCRVLGLLRRC